MAKRVWKVKFGASTTEAATTVLVSGETPNDAMTKASEVASRDKDDIEAVQYLGNLEE